jgi:hypothetical protein
MYPVRVDIEEAPEFLLRELRINNNSRRSSCGRLILSPMYTDDNRSVPFGMHESSEIVDSGYGRTGSLGWVNPVGGVEDIYFADEGIDWRPTKSLPGTEKDTGWDSRVHNPPW